MSSRCWADGRHPGHARLRRRHSRRGPRRPVACDGAGTSGDARCHRRSRGARCARPRGQRGRLGRARVCRQPGAASHSSRASARGSECAASGRARSRRCTFAAMPAERSTSRPTSSASARSRGSWRTARSMRHSSTAFATRKASMSWRHACRRASPGARRRPKSSSMATLSAAMGTTIPYRRG